ncbi:MAG: response regulator, partial [Deltaproteobacteria bacterium]|nr:response regulator [Deltaproteobacteria bacterium]
GLEQVKDHVRVVEVDSAEKGLKLFESGGFDYVIADIDLGKRKMNGYDFTQEILQKYPNTCVLIHSNKRKEELDIEIRECARYAPSPQPSPSRGEGEGGGGIDRFMGFLPKPMKASELLQFLACRSFETISPSPQPSPIKGEGVSKKVLLLNDDEGLNFSIGMTLKSQNMQVTDVTNVKDALQCLANNKFDMIISDINLGENQPDGYDFLKEVQKTCRSVPFIFASGYSKAEEWPKASAAGAIAYLQLPLEPKEMAEIFS